MGLPRTVVARNRTSRPGVSTHHPAGRGHHTPIVPAAGGTSEGTRLCGRRGVQPRPTQYGHYT